MKEALDLLGRLIEKPSRRATDLLRPATADSTPTWFACVPSYFNDNLDITFDAEALVWKQGTRFNFTRGIVYPTTQDVWADQRRVTPWCFEILDGTPAVPGRAPSETRPAEPRSPGRVVFLERRVSESTVEPGTRRELTQDAFVRLLIGGPLALDEPWVPAPEIRRMGWREENAGQIARFNAQRVAARDVAGFLGLLDGVLLDGHVHDRELAGIQRWFDSNPALSSTWPFGALASVVQRVLDDGVITDDERLELARVIELVIESAQPLTAPPARAARESTELPPVAVDPTPLFDPPAPIDFAGRTFCFTGKMRIMSRPAAAAAVTARGGKPTDNATFQLDYLVVGVDGSEAWSAGSYGRKIEAVMTNKRRDGAATRVIRESDFAEAIKG